MEWSGHQQLLYFLESTVLGLVLGLLFDLHTAVGRLCCRRTVLLLDALFGIPAALITFFASLAITDGRLHPLLFFGALAGGLIEHVCVGCLLERWTFVVLRHFVKSICWLVRKSDEWAVKTPRFIKELLIKRGSVAKKRKKFRFFQKNT